MAGLLLCGARASTSWHMALHNIHERSSACGRQIQRKTFISGRNKNAEKNELDGHMNISKMHCRHLHFVTQEMFICGRFRFRNMIMSPGVISQSMERLETGRSQVLIPPQPIYSSEARESQGTCVNVERQWTHVDPRG